MQPTQAINILLVDNHALVRSGISLLLNTYPEFVVVGQAGSGSEALAFPKLEEVDVAVLEVELPGEPDAIGLMSLVRARNPQARFVVLTNSLYPGTIHGALRAGALAYLLKTTTIDELAQAIRAAYHGRPSLSPEATQALVQQAAAPARLASSLTTREQQVLELMSKGWNNQRIAAHLNITLSTVQFHVGNILAKLEVHNRTEAAAFALRHHLAHSRNWARDGA